MDKNRPPPRPGIADSHGTGTATRRKSGHRSNNVNSNSNANNNNANNDHQHQHQHQGGTTKRQQYTNRARTLSSGSTRGAFGPITVKDAQKQHDEIYRVQNAAMTRNYRNINKNDNDRNSNLPPVEVKVTEHQNQNMRDEETGNINGNGNGKGNGHPLYRHHNHHNERPSSSQQQQQQQISSNEHQRVTSTDSNTRFMFSHHSPTLEDLQLQAQKEREIQMFASMATNTEEHHGNVKPMNMNMSNDKYAHYGSNNLNHSWDDHPHPGNMENNLNDTFSYDDQSYENESQEESSFFKDLFHQLVHDPHKPEFSSLQQTIWAILIGIFMGVFTAAWGQAVEVSVDFVWATVPGYLLEMGIFTDLDGRLPLPHYIWICPAIFGGIVSYITAKYTEHNIPIPGQNEWIESLHRVGVMDHARFFPVVILSTLGMASGLSLGPEMPLILSSSMVGSWLALKTNQSVLSARVINLVAASAAIGGFFGFPMAGALFVLELPHRMGLQYFEALSPCVIASIVSVITNRLVTKKHVEGYFDYPFLAETLPSDVFYTAIIYGMVGTLVGILYAEGCLWCKHWVHDWFHVAHDDHGHGDHGEEDHGQGHEETAALMGDIYKEKFLLQPTPKPGCYKRLSNCFTNCFGISHEPTRAAAAGVMVGVVVGLICMFLPHQLFWGEAQLQTLIDRGNTPLPIFEYDGPTSILTAYGYCMVDPEDEREGVLGYSTACMGVLSFTKILTIGLSLGTGICGGHFWGPLYVGCAAGHFFSDMMALVKEDYDFAGQLSMFPCVAILCFMGSTHVVTYRCHMAIMLVLTLTITSFQSETKQGKMAGDYAAIFPLLVVACFVPLVTARGTIFYAKQRCRGDIIAIPEVLCEPMKANENNASYVEDVYDDDDDDFSYNSGSVSEGLSFDGNDNVSDSASASANYDRGVVMETLDSGGKQTINSEEAGHVRKSSNSSNSIDPLGVSTHSRISLSRRKLSTGSGPVRRPSVGQVDELQPNLLDQSRHERSPSLQMPVPPKGHRRKGSNLSMRSATGDSS